MKKIVSLILLFVLLFTVGCSAEKNNEKTDNSKNSPVEISQLNSFDLIFTEICQDFLYAFATEKKSVKYDDYNGDFLDEYYLIKFGFTDDSFYKVNISDYTTLTQYNGMNVDQNGNIEIFDENSEMAINFDKDFKFLSEDKYDKEHISVDCKDNFAVDDTFNFKDFGAVYNVRENCGTNFDVFVFNQDVNNVYISSPYYDECLASSSKLILGCSYNNISRLNIGVYDYTNSLCINQTVINCDMTDGGSVTPVNCALSDNYAFVNAMCYYGDEETMENHCYYWQYKSGAENSEISFDVYNETALKNLNDSLANDIKKLYGINVFIDKSTGLESKYNFNLKSNSVKTYNVLMQMKTFLASLGENFIYEMYNDYVGNPNKYNSLNICLVNSINDDMSSVFDNKTDSLVVAFSTEHFVFSSLPHEFMHIIKARIDDYGEKNNININKQWQQLNPKGFNYASGQKLDEDLMPYFVTENALVSIDEEMADIFAMLYCDSKLEKSPVWLSDNAHIRLKAQVLCNLIRQAYPSLSDTDTQCWEKWTC